jgi:hypothetical protein
MYDWSLVFPELPPLKKNFFTKYKVRKAVFLLRQISSLLIYISVMMYIVFPFTVLSITLFIIGLSTKAVFYFLNSLSPNQPDQNIDLEYPELHS